jgi:hypothetical protein
LLDRLNRATEAAQFLEMLAGVSPWDWDARLALAERRKASDAIVGIASSPEAPYAIRARAARLSPAAAELGSVELNTLAGRPGAQLAGLSFYGRLEAGEASQNRAERIRFWREAIAAQPMQVPESLRWRLSAEASSAGDMTLTVSAVELGLAAAGWNSVARSLEFRQDHEMVERPLASAGATNADRARAAVTLAGALRRLGRLSDARALFTAAERLAPGTGKAGLDSVIAEIDRRGQNAARAPVVTDNLDQPHTVRPRLAAAQGEPR